MVITTCEDLALPFVDAPPFDLRPLLPYACRAPSPDNNQPWRFAPSDSGLWLGLDLDRALPSDVNHMFDLIGLGAAVENMSLAARQQGYDLAVDLVNPGVPWPTRRELGDAPPTAAAARCRTIAHLGTRSSNGPDKLFASIDERCTSRRLFSRRPIAAATLSALHAETTACKGVRVDFVTQRSALGRLASIVAATDSIRFQYEPFHNEIFHQLRFDPAEVEATRDGLDVRTLALPPGAAGALCALRPWARMRWIHRLRLTGLLAFPSWMAMICSGAIGVLTVDRASEEAFFRAGRALQRLWLAATAMGISFHPVGSPAIFFAHVQQLDGRRLATCHAAALRRSMRRFQALLPECSDRTVAMFFRLGSGGAAQYRTLRRPVSAALEE